MNKTYSLVHLTDISCPPPEMIRIAARAGYDTISLRTIPMGLVGELTFDIARDKQLYKQTKRAVEETGIKINDIENARIYDEVEIKKYEPCLEAAASLGVKHVLTNIWTPNKSFYTEKFSELCEMALKYGQTVNVEFVTWASVKDIKTTKELLETSGYCNVGIVVDILHFYRSRCTLNELEGLPKEWFNFIHLCDCEEEIPTDEESLIHAGRAERQYPGDGAVDIRSIVEKIPNVIYGIEVPHLERVKELGFEEHARRALQKTKEYFREI
jgi:sugar phosphate isomerase/epimerase